ncbi:MAG: PVC-type heme-binding CxxCH protein [Planctomycetota bacterium]
MNIPRHCQCALLFVLLAVNALHAHAAKPAEPNAAADHAVVEAMLRLPKQPIAKDSPQAAALSRHLTRLVGTPRYVQVAQQLGAPDQTDNLINMLTTSPFNNLAVDAARLLAKENQWASLESILEDENTEKAAAAAFAIGYLNNERARKILQAATLDNALSLQVRIGATAGLAKTEPGQRFLLQLAQDEKVPDALKFAVTDGLLSSDSKDIRSEAEKHVQRAASRQKEKLPPVKELARRRGNGGNGKQVFSGVGTCNKCHKVAGEGKEVGPDLSEIGSKLSREDMYVAILNPNAAISHNYENFALLDLDGRVVNGLKINQTDDDVTIRDKDGVDHKVSMDDVASLKKQAVSLMPSDLQETMSLQQLSDLVEYLISLRKSEPRPEGNNSAEPSQKIEIDTSHDPTKAIAGFEIAEGLEVQLFAYEPQLLSPTSIDVDALGRVWVCEAVNYRHFRNGQNKARDEGDRILVLEDTDGDGRADKETVFYQSKEIDSPHGVCVIGNQVIVSAGSKVIVFTDEDGDLKPESKRDLFTGISGVQHDHGIHAFGVGPDGKMYFNFGNAGRQLKGPNGESIVDMAGNRVDDSRNPYQQGMVFRCNLDGSQLETLGWNFRNNWEVCVDSFGTLWQSDNDDDGNRGTRINYVMEFGNYGYRDERTGASWRGQRIGLEDTIPLQHWHLNDPGVVPNILQTGAGSPTGIFFYEGDLLPEPFQNQLLHTDPGPNVVRAYPVEKTGAGYQASIRNLIKGINDPWFRPVDVCAAPDGSLFVADWYDPGVGGHRMGDIQHGRIFRIVPKGHQGYAVDKIDLQSAKGVVKALQSPNLATRFLAQQAIAGMGKAAVPALENLALNAKSDRIKARALWQLGLVGNNVRKYVEIAVSSDNPDLRCMGVRFARQHGADLIALVEEMKGDESPQVRRELAIALRHHQDPKAADLWVELAMQHDGKDRWYLEALGIAADRQWDSFFAAWLEKVGDNWNTEAGRDIIWRSRSPRACRYLVEIIQATQSEQEQYRYFRAFDFHEGKAKTEALSELVTSR